MKNNNEKFIEDITASVRQDFLDRQQQRKSFESQWRLNNNFLLGNQYVGIDNFDDLQEVQKAFEIGAHAVVIGSAITRPQLITKRFIG